MTAFRGFWTGLGGLVKRCALLPGCHAPWQREEDAPVLHDQLRHKGHLHQDAGAGGQIAHADGEHVLQQEPKPSRDMSRKKNIFQPGVQRLDVRERPGPSGRPRGHSLLPTCTLCGLSLSPLPGVQTHTVRELLVAPDKAREENGHVPVPPRASR